MRRTRPSSRVCARGHLVTGANRSYRGDCLVCVRLLAHGLVKPSSGPASEPWNPYYANNPCPSCGSRATVPFDPRPERAGREPSSGLGTCTACGHVFSSLALASSAEQEAPPSASSGGANGSDRRVSGVASRPVAPTTHDTARSVTSGRRYGKPELPSQDASA